MVLCDEIANPVLPYAFKIWTTFGSNDLICMFLEAPIAKGKVPCSHLESVVDENSCFGFCQPALLSIEVGQLCSPMSMLPESTV